MAAPQGGVTSDSDDAVYCAEFSNSSEGIFWGDANNQRREVDESSETERPDDDGARPRSRAGSAGVGSRGARRRPGGSVRPGRPGGLGIERRRHALPYPLILVSRRLSATITTRLRNTFPLARIVEFSTLSVGASWTRSTCVARFGKTSKNFASNSPANYRS